MSGLRAMAWRGLLRQRARSLLTVIAVTLGVANVFAVFVVNRTIDRGVERQSRAFLDGDADVVARRAQNDLARATIEELRRAEGVRDAWAIMDYWDTDKPKGTQTTYVVGAIDSVGREQLVGTQLVRGRLFGVGRPEVVLTQSASRALGLDIGDHWRTDLRKFDERAEEDYRSRLRLEDGAARIHRLEVTGIVFDPVVSDPSWSFGSWTSLEYTWKVFRPDIAWQVRFRLDDAADPAEWMRDAETRWPELQWESNALAPEVRRFVVTIQGLLAGTSALALFVGAFLIYLTFSIAIVERTRLYGLLHAVGASRRDVARAVMVESLIVGTVASILGVIVGAGLSFGLIRLVGRIVPLSVTGSPVVTPSGIAIAVLVGLAATSIGAAVPAWRAARLSPVAAIRSLGPDTRAKSRSWVTGVVLLAAGLAYAVFGKLETTNAGSPLATLAVLSGSVLVTQPMLVLVARVIGGTISRFAPGLGGLAVTHVTRERSRSAYTLALVMVVLAAIFTVGATNHSFRNILDDWLDKRFGADLFLYGPEIDDREERRVAAVEGVGSVTSVAFGTRARIVDPVEVTENVVLIDPDGFFEVAGFPWADGDDAGARAALRRGDAILLPARTAEKAGIERGDRVGLAVGERERRFTVAGLYATLARGPEVGIVASAADERFFREDRTNNALYLNYDPDVDEQRVLSSLRRELTPVPDDKRPVEWFQEQGMIGPYFAITGAAIKDRAHAEFETFFRLFIVVVLIAAIVGVLGMANTLATTVLQRFREIGILQAVGARPADVRRMILAESVILTTAAFVLSIGLGTVLAWMFNRGAGADAGFTVRLSVPWTLVPTLAVIAVAVAAAAAAVPARRAQRLTPVEALRYE